MQISITTLEKDEGLSYEEAVKAMELNKAQIERHGSFLPARQVGFYVKKRPQCILQTGKDRIKLITGQIRNAASSEKFAVKVLQRMPWSAAGIKPELRRVKDEWKLCDNEVYAKDLWDFWYKCVFFFGTCPSFFIASVCTLLFVQS